MLQTHWRVWLITANNALQETFANRFANLLFFTGKAVRLFVMILFLVLVKNQVKSFAGYSTDQMIVVFITYQIVDQVSQLIYRGVYMFGQQIRTGEFDFLLLRPINPLFASLTGKPDINDTIFLIPFSGVLYWLFSNLSLTITPLSTLIYILLLINAFLIATSLHILILVVGILSTEVDGTVWFIRDLAKLGQFPIDTYREPFRFALFFLVPIGIMITIPAQALVSYPTTLSLAATCFAGIMFFWISLQLWHYALRLYSSASS